ncbi:putative a, transposase OrfB [Burkholderia mallei]|nr:putative a, transposase OrfB [Burkholderia mallei]
MAIREKVNISERRACRLVGLSRSVLHYDAKPDHENEVLAARLVKLGQNVVDSATAELHALVEREGTHANTSASISCTARQGWLCGAVLSATAS